MRAVLTYHSLDVSGSPISVAPDAFARQMAWLASSRVEVTTLDRLCAMPDSADAAAITFDDGFENLATTGAPILRRYGFPATVFVVAGHVGRDNRWGGREAPGIPTLPLMTWETLERIQREGVRIGAHTRTHAALPGLAAAALDEEVRGSADTIQERLGTRPDAFAYPYGRVDQAAVAAVEASFALGCTTELAVLPERPERARLPRLDMYYFQRPGRLESWGSAALTRWLSWRRALRRVRASVG